MAGVIGSLVFLGSPACSLVTRLSPRKTGGGESLGTSTVKAVDFWHLGLVVPIRLQNEITCSRDLFRRHCRCALRALSKHTSFIAAHRISVVKDELSEFVCKKCVTALEKAEDALRLQKEVVTSLSATTLRH